LLPLQPVPLTPLRPVLTRNCARPWAKPFSPPFSSTCLGLSALPLIQLIVREGWPGSDKFAHTPWWAWFGGALSIASTFAGITLAQRMGSGVFTGLSITASVVTSVVLDNFGWVGFKVHPVSWPRAAGCVLMVAGLWLVSKF
jgi:bacterial/archaeal transporter family-2 protein